MLTITVPESELFNELTNEIIPIKETKLQLEHSLLSVSKWESKWHKPFLSKDGKTQEETIDYIKCMTITPNVKDETYLGLSSENIKQVVEYIEDSMTATWFSNKNEAKKGKEIVTSELIYYWMISQNIPIECQKWHLNRLLTLIEICVIKNTPPKKQSRKDIISSNKALNDARRKKMNSLG